MVARDIMSTDVLTINQKATAREAADLLASSHYGALPVVNDENEVVGVVSYHDLIRLALPEYLEDVDLSFLPPSAEFFPKTGEYANIGDVPVAKIMRRDFLPEVTPDEPVAEVARIMLKEHVRRVVVVENKKLVGIITRGDVVRAIVHPTIRQKPSEQDQ